MGRFDNKWSSQHAAAIVAAVLDEGRPQVQVLREAKTQGLGDLPPFDMPRSTARYYIEQEQRRRDASQAAAKTSADIPRTADTILQRALSLCDREMSKLEKAAKPDITALDKLAKTAANIKKQAGFAPAQADTEPTPGKPTESSNAQSLLDAMRSTQGGTTREPDPASSVVVEDGWAETETDTDQDYSSRTRSQDQDVRDQLAAGV